MSIPNRDATYNRRSKGLLDIAEVRRLRVARGLTQGAAAMAARLPGGRDSWADIETGRRVNITLDTLEALSRALETEPAALLVQPKARRSSALKAR